MKFTSEVSKHQFPPTYDSTSEIITLVKIDLIGLVEVDLLFFH